MDWAEQGFASHHNKGQLGCTTLNDIHKKGLPFGSPFRC
ncbi:hypothetical protein VCHA37P191_230058 [Vibrio chagasii]|nr:hypothetical protein VCHA36O157_170052 [Vibrio chagasii]CAH7001861.1 hypothetical protein VCHA41O249_180058 [Vibrio chagasii]CAH7153394.1 hypothetical protein VCHA37P191_230058 [Vibrio chagasii]